MKTSQGKFYYVISPEVVIDLGQISEMDWAKIKKTTREMLDRKETDDIGMAYIIAFVFYIAELEMLAQPYNPDEDLFQ